MLTLSTATGRICDITESLFCTDRPSELVTLCAAAKVACREILRYIDAYEDTVMLLDGDLADLGFASARLVATLRDLAPAQSFNAAGFCLTDASVACLRLCTYLQRLCADAPCFEDA